MRDFDNLLQKKSIFIALFVIVIILVVGAGLILVFNPWQTGAPIREQKLKQEVPKPTQAIPKTNPFEVKTNPFKDIKTNPFK